MKKKDPLIIQKIAIIASVLMIIINIVFSSESIRTVFWLNNITFTIIIISSYLKISNHNKKNKTQQ